MKFYALVLAASASVISACAGGDKANPADTVAVATDTSTAAAPSAAPAAITEIVPE